jgi:hypothetical protein
VFRNCRSRRKEARFGHIFHEMLELWDLFRKGIKQLLRRASDRARCRVKRDIQHPRSEIRDPKSERNPKAEIRRIASAAGLDLDYEMITPAKSQYRRLTEFGLRISGFGFRPELLDSFASSFGFQGFLIGQSLNPDIPIPHRPAMVLESDVALPGKIFQGGAELVLRAVRILARFGPTI